MADGSNVLGKQCYGNIKSPSDPADIFGLVQPHLQSLLPLKDLHWNSSSRPLRSISSLHVELVPDSNTASKRPDDKREKETLDGSSSPHQRAISNDRSSKKERRHQIPGLRQTPYLKIFLLQGDDIEIYKAESRQALREWVSHQAPATQSHTAVNQQEKHDAFEWLIVYLESDGTELSGALSNSRGDAENLRKTSSSRWKARSSKTVIEKVRADIGALSKHAVDHIAQIYVPKSSNSVDPSKRDLQDVEGNLGDLVKKMKALILASFDQRVQQYEEDIKEKEFQRNLPGWNFNTFFVLKEGLALGFESVGLVEDALTGYRELAAGLSSVINEQLTDASEQQTAHFHESTAEIQHAFQQAKQVSGGKLPKSEASNTKTIDVGLLVLDTDRKPFRNLILENNISVFDFQCYVFARQVSLLLRLANAHLPLASPEQKVALNNESTNSSRLEDGWSDAQQVNHHLLAQICHLSFSFIGASAWNIRRDIEAPVNQAAMHDDIGENEAYSPLDYNVIDNVVASWTFSACQCILDATATPFLSLHVGTSMRQLRRSSLIQSDVASQGEVDGSQSKSYPRRSSSLFFRSPSVASQFPGPTRTSEIGQRLPPISQRHGASELAALRGDLLALKKRTLASLGKRLKAWQTNSASLVEHHKDDPSLQEVDLENEAKESGEGRASFSSGTLNANGVFNEILLKALQSQNNFYAQYEDSTALALAHYLVAERAKMAEASTADLASLYFYVGDHSTAVTYFKQLTPSYNEKEWLSLGTTILEMWAQSLRELGHHSEYIVVALKALRGAAFHAHQPISSPVSLKAIIKASMDLKDKVILPLEGFFHNIKLEPFLHHSVDQDAFEMTLYLRSVLLEGFRAHSVRVDAVEVGDEISKEIFVSTQEVLEVKQGSNRIRLSSNTVSPGWYNVKRISIVVGNILFEQDYSQPTDALKLAHNKTTIEESRPEQFKVWAANRSVAVSILPSRCIDLSQPRSIDVILSAGWNDIIRGRLLLRPASAGLRLHTAKAESFAGDHLQSKDAQAGTIRFGKLAPDTDIALSIPYELETSLDEIQLRFEVYYTTSKGDFTYSSKAKVPIRLTIAVNVQETFKKNNLFSRFTIGPVTASPIRIIDTTIADSMDIEARLFPSGIDGAATYSAHPVCAVAKFRRRPQDGIANAAGNMQQRIFLKIRYMVAAMHVAKAVETHMLETLSLAGVQDYSRVLSQHLTDRLHNKFSPPELELCGLTSRIFIGSFDDYGWEEVLQVLTPSKATQVKQVLQQWHQTAQSLPLETVVDKSLEQQLTLAVDLPEVKILHTVQLRLTGNVTLSSPSTKCVSQGQSISAELVIEHTRQWSRGMEDQKPLNFTFSIQSNSDSWLVGGQRNASFSAKANDRLAFPLFLLPQKTGHLLLPTVEVHPVSTTNVDRNVHKAVAPSFASANSITCSTDYLSQAETVLVIPNLSTTTVSLASDDFMDEPRLLESQQKAV